MNSIEDLRTLVGELVHLFRESADFHRASAAPVATLLDSAVEAVMLQYHRLAAIERRYVLGFVGLSNVGKSTLLNALLEAELAPRKNGPCTAVPVEFVYGPQTSLEIEYLGTFERRRIECVSTEELRLELNALVNDAGGTAARELERVVATLPHPLLERFTIADTPGFGAAQAGDASGSHEHSLREYLCRQVSRVIWVTSSEQGILAREIEFYRSGFAPLCDDIVVTRCADWDERDRTRYRRRFETPFGRRPPRFHFTELLEQPRSGVAELRDYLTASCRREHRLQEAVTALRLLCTDLTTWFRERCPTLGNTLWRPDSWRRLTATTACNGLREELTTALKEEPHELRNHG